MDRTDPSSTAHPRSWLALVVLALAMLALPSSGALRGAEAPLAARPGATPSFRPAGYAAVALGDALGRVDAPALQRGLYVLAVSQPPASERRADNARPPATHRASSEAPQEPSSPPASAAPPAALPPDVPPRAAAAPSPAPASCPAAAMAGRARNLFDAINGERNAAGLPSLALDGCLVHIAQRRADDMATRGYFAHVSPDGESFGSLLDAFAIDFFIAAENLARNNAVDADAVGLAVRDLMASPPHRENILSVETAYLGVAEAVDGAGFKYYVMLFLGR